MASNLDSVRIVELEKIIEEGILSESRDLVTMSQNIKSMYS